MRGAAGRRWLPTLAGEIEIDIADLAEVESALALTEVAIMLDGKGGFDMTQKGKDFDATLNSYLCCRVAGPDGVWAHTRRPDDQRRETIHHYISYRIP